MRGDIDGVMMDLANAYDLEKRGQGRILVRFGDFKEFVTESSSPPTR